MLPWHPPAPGQNFMPKSAASFGQHARMEIPVNFTIQPSPASQFITVCGWLFESYS